METQSKNEFITEIDTMLSLCIHKLLFLAE